MPEKQEHRPVSDNVQGNGLNDTSYEDAPRSAKGDSTGSKTPERIAADRFKARLQGRKYFDSGEYVMSGKTVQGGSMLAELEHPCPEKIPHSDSTGSIGKSSPMKTHVFSSESLLLQDLNDNGLEGDDSREDSDEEEKEEENGKSIQN